MNPHMDKLPQATTAEINGLARELWVDVKPTDCHAPKMTLMADSFALTVVDIATLAIGTGLSEVDAGELSNLVAL